MAASGLILSPSAIAASSSQRRFDPFVNKPIQVFVTASGGRCYPFPLEGAMIDSVKILIQTFKGSYVNQHMFVYGGMELILKEHMIQHDGFVYFVLRLMDLISVSLETTNGTKTYTINQNDGAKGIRMHIKKSQAGCQHSVKLRDDHLGESKVTEDVELDEKAVLYLVVQKPIKLKSKFIGRTSMELEITTGKVNVQLKSSIIQRDSSLKSSITGREEALGHRHASSLRPYYSIQLTNHPIRCEVSASLRDFLDHVRMGLHAGQSPTLTPEGSSGVYFMKDECGMQNIGVFKPMDEEPMALNNPRGLLSSQFTEGLKKGTKSGGGAIREVAAYLLDYAADGKSKFLGSKDEEGFASVPITTMVRCFHEAFNYGSSQQMLYRKPKLGSLQQYINAMSSCEDMGASIFPVEEVHKITVLDLRLANTDRHAGNILACRREDGSLKLVPIDHGYCIPENFQECTFEWLYWPQACQPYGASTLKYIDALDAEHDITLLRKHGWNLQRQIARVLRISTMVLKKGAKCGLTPFQIGCIVSRMQSGARSPIEYILEEAEFKRAKRSTEESFLKIVEKLLDRLIAQMKAA